MGLPSDQVLLDMYSKMCLTRHLNDELIELKTAKQIYGPIHTSTGQEAMGVAVGAALRDDDYVISNHRGYAHWIGKGMDLDPICGEIFGKESGCCRGKAGEMLIADLSRKVMSTTIVGGGMPLAVGLGMSIRMRRSDQVVVCFFGDGAANEGAFHEALNFGALRRVPVVFFCENNQWALSTHVRRSTSVRDIAIRSLGYDVPGYIVDGNDVFDVHELMQEVVPELRSGGGPVLVEAKTYRQRGFSSNDRANGYQPVEQSSRWKAKDPIMRFRLQLLELNVGSDATLAELDDKARTEAHAAIARARTAEYPPVSALYENVFAPQPAGTSVRAAASGYQRVIDAIS